MRANVISVLALGLLTAACGSDQTHRATGSALNSVGLGPGSPPASAQAQSSRLMRDAQAELQREGLYKGRIDGIDGPLTQQAVRDYQQREGLQQTAVLDQPTLERMNLANEAAQTAQGSSRTAAVGSGTSSAPASLSADDIRARLEQAGYTHVRDIRREANIYTAHAEQGDTRYRVRVDARSGQVLSQHRLAAQQSGAATPGAASTSSTTRAPSATTAGGNEANPNAAVPPNAPSAVGSDNANDGTAATSGSGTSSVPSSSPAAPSVAPSAGTSAPSESAGAATSGTSSHGSDVTPPTPDQQSGGGAGNTSETGTNQ